MSLMGIEVMLVLYVFLCQIPSQSVQVFCVRDPAVVGVFQTPALQELSLPVSGVLVSELASANRLNRQTELGFG